VNSLRFSESKYIGIQWIELNVMAPWLFCVTAHIIGPSIVKAITVMKSTALKLFLVGLGLSAVWNAHAQTAAPSAQQMIEQLKAPAPGAPRLRSLRNLTVESTNAPSAEATDPSAQASAATGAAAASSAPLAAAPQAKPSLSLLIQFDFNSSQIRPESQQALLNLSQALNSPELALSKFAVEGHTDAKGLAEYNQKLSQLRAEAVQAFLVKNGVTQSRLAAAGKGSTQLANAANPLGAENRRVRIVNLD
jgi:outer membrane protein OmpA-like peptidoglycan-associated protein